MKFLNAKQRADLENTMRLLVQRVRSARVLVGKRQVGHINHGLLLFAGFRGGDTESDISYLCEKICHLRVFNDGLGKMNRSVVDIDGEVLVVSQFTLYGDCRRGRRPSFQEAASPQEARVLYDGFVCGLRDGGVRVSTGEFQAAMDVELVNDGPVTLMLDSDHRREA